MINKELELTIGATIRDAENRKHEYLTVEHILFAVLHDEWGAEIIANCGGNISRLKSTIENFFDKSVPRQAKDTVSYPKPTLGFQRVIQRALAHVESAGKKEADA